MNKRIDFTKLGGYPLAQEDLEWLQSSYRNAFSALAGLAGDMVIITGMAEAAGNITAGWISLNGELIPFAAGAINTGEFTLQETVTPLVFNDGISKDVLYEKIAVFSAGGEYNYNDLKRLNTLKLGLVPSGAIVMWSGAVGNIPAGWLLCDGTFGTPNLSGKFIAGYDAANGDYDIGDTGGSSSVTLSPGQQGKFKAKAKVDDISGGTASAIASISLQGVEVPKNGGSNQSSFGTEIDVPLSAATDAIDKRPPYYTLAFIMKS